MPLGQAYAFFDCRATSEQIDAALPTIREMVNTPSELELKLILGPRNLGGDARLQAIEMMAVNAGLKYVLAAKLPGASNERTANELGGIVNQMYQSPLYNEG